MLFANNNIEFNLYCAREDHCVPEHSFGPGMQKTSVFKYIKSGSGIYCIGTKKYHLKKGDCFFFTPNDIVYYKADKENPWHYMWVSVGGKTMNYFIQKCFEATGEYAFTPKNPQNIEKYYLELMTTRESLKSYSAFLNLADEVLSQIYPDLNYAETNKNNFVEFTKNYLNQNCHRTVMVSELCTLLGFERSYLCRLFKSKTGLSPQEYIISFKMKRAEYLIKNEFLNVSQAAKSVGYDDQSAFGKLFKQYYGYSPSTLKKISRQRN